MRVRWQRTRIARSNLREGCVREVAYRNVVDEGLRVLGRGQAQMFADCGLARSFTAEEEERPTLPRYLDKTMRVEVTAS